MNIKINFLKESKYREVIITVVKYGGILLFLGAILYFTGNDIKEKNNNIALLKQKAADDAYILREYPVLLEEKKKFDPAIQSIDKMIPDEDGLLSLKNYLDMEANSLKITPTLLFGQKYSPSESLTAMRFSLNLSAASQNDIVLLIDRLRKIPFFLGIDSFVLDRVNFSGSGHVFIKDQQ